MAGCRRRNGPRKWGSRQGERERGCCCRLYVSGFSPGSCKRSVLECAGPGCAATVATLTVLRNVCRRRSLIMRWGGISNSLWFCDCGSLKFVRAFGSRDVCGCLRVRVRRVRFGGFVSLSGLSCTMIFCDVFLFVCCVYVCGCACERVTCLFQRFCVHKRFRLVL